MQEISVEKRTPCPHCGEELVTYANPTPTVDVVILVPGGCDGKDGVVLIERLNPPYGMAIPGGFVDEGETCEHAAIREMKEETGLDIILTGLLGVYSDPKRDPRKHTLSVVYMGVARNPEQMVAGDDAGNAMLFPLGEWPELVFDHRKILDDFLVRYNRLNLV